MSEEFDLAKPPTEAQIGAVIEHCVPAAANVIRRLAFERDQLQVRLAREVEKTKQQQREIIELRNEITR